MTTVIVWFMLACPGYNSNMGTCWQAMFATPQACQEAVSRMNNETAATRGMPLFRGVCFKAEILK